MIGQQKTYRKYVTLSFDDGTIFDIPFLERINFYGLKCTFNLNSGLFGQKHDLFRDGAYRCHDELTEEQVKEIYHGHEIASHSLTHPDLCRLSDEDIQTQVCQDRQNLQNIFHQDITGFAYPGGICDQRVARVLSESCGIRYARTVESHRRFTMPDNLLFWPATCHQADPALFDLTEQFLQAEPRDGDLLFYVWGHSYEFQWDGTWDRWETFCKRISGSPEIQYVTNLQVANHLMQ